MKLFLVFMVLLSEVPQDRAWPKKCFNNVSGLCRKRCKLGEISEMGCLSGKLCCVNEGENRKYLEARKPPARTADKSAEVQDYIALPTTTLLTTAAQP
ncbi:beta-defensin 128 [Lepus europaeus]|uniref:beta-defensin 128 n=1 Tax=Lepus europaeus TaxID=9983 RepID=UPI002B45B070|nr:beta-defensin 128 [Lepus europaeus]